MTVQINLELKANAVFSLNELELRALDALVGYGVDNFLLVFYEKLGQAYLRPHEQGLRSLFKTIDENVRPALHKMDDIHKVLKGK